MPKVVLPHTFEEGDVINPAYVNECFSALSAGINSVGPANFEQGLIPNDLLQKQYAVSVLSAPMGNKAIEIAIDNGAAGDGNEDQIAIAADETITAYLGALPMDATVINVAWNFTQAGGIDTATLKVFAAGLRYTKEIPAAGDFTSDEDTSFAVGANTNITVELSDVTAVAGAAIPYLYKDPSVTLTLRYELVV
jgi:hypothetical protein